MERCKNIISIYLFQLYFIALEIDMLMMLMSWFQQESRPNDEDQWSQILSGQWASSSTQKVAGSVFAVSLPKWLLVAVKELA